MNKLCTCSLLSLLLTTSLISCEDVDNIPLTREDGRPSALKGDGKASFFSYEGKRLANIQEGDGSSLRLHYENNELTSLDILPPRNVADGSGFTRFGKKDEQTITIENCGEPSLDMRYTSEISLDNEGLPIKITDAGVFVQTGEGIIQREEGRYYTIFTIDPSTKNLLRLDTYSLTDSSLVESYTYKYDSRPGLTSQVDCPSWLPYYWSYRYTYSFNSKDILFLNHRNNVVEINYKNHQEALTTTATYSYTYNNKQYPTRIKESMSGMRIEVMY